MTKDIYSKYPKVWGEMIKCFTYPEIEKVFDGNYCVYLNGTLLTFCFNYYNEFVECKTCWEQSDFEGENQEVPFNMMYGLLEDFFMDNGIVIYFERDLLHSGWYPCIDVPKDKDLNYVDATLYKNKNEAKEQAILKASEILEGRL